MLTFRSVADEDISVIGILAATEERLVGEGKDDVYCACRLSYIFVFEEGNIGCQGGMAVGQDKNLGRFEAVGMNFPPSFPAFKVQALSSALEVMETSRMPCFS